MSKLLDSIDRWQPNLRPTQGGAGGKGLYKAATVGIDPSYAPGPDMSRLVQFGSDAYGYLKSKQKSLADERSDEIIRKLTPEQRREAIKNGTLDYKDDPYAMQALRIKTGRNAGFLTDDTVMTGIKEGRYTSREEMEKVRHESLQANVKSYAEQFGIDPSDVDFQKGFNADITERNIALYRAHDAYLSDRAMKGNLINSKVELNGVLSDPSMVAKPEAATFLNNYVTEGLRTGSIPSDAQALQLISTSLNDVVQRPNGAGFLQNLAGQTVTLNGATSTYKELMGDEQWNSMMVKAQSSQFQNDAKLMEKFQLDMNSALNQENTSTGWEMLQAQKEQLDKLQPGEELTPQRQLLIQAQAQLQDRFRQESKAAAKAMDDQKKTINKQQVIDKQFEKRLNGEYVSTDFKDMPTNENTGEFKHSDMVNYANQKLASIDQMQISDAQKDKLKLDYLRSDSESGPFRTAIGQMVTDAGNEWQASVINGKVNQENPALDNLRRLRNTDPNLVAALYPDKADLFLTMDMLDKQGIDPQVLIDADRSRKDLTKEMQYEDDKSWAALKNNSESPELSRIPASLDGMARKIYDSFKYRTGNADGAMEQVDKFLKESTVTFVDENVDGKGAIGVIPKNSLQVSDDPKSWEQGRDIIDEARKGIIASNPWITNKQLTIYQQGDSIFMMDTTGTVRVRYDKELLQAVYKDTTEKASEKARNEALAEANKRAPITQATKARKAAGERVRANRKKVPKFIYGRKE